MRRRRRNGAAQDHLGRPLPVSSSRRERATPSGTNERPMASAGSARSRRASTAASCQVSVGTWSTARTRSSSGVPAVPFAAACRATRVCARPSRELARRRRCSKRQQLALPYEFLPELVSLASTPMNPRCSSTQTLSRRAVPPLVMALPLDPRRVGGERLKAERRPRRTPPEAAPPAKPGGRCPSSGGSRLPRRARA